MKENFQYNSQKKSSIPSINQVIRFVVVAGLMPAFLTYVVYFAFLWPLTGDVFSQERFNEVYGHGIFEYRILGIFLLESIAEAIGTYNLPETAPEHLVLMHPNTVTDWFSAFFYLNLITLCAAMAVFFVLLESMRGESPAFFTDITLMAILLTISISQYVIVPYDMLSYLFLGICMYCIFLRPNSWSTIIILCVTMVFATLTRETAALILSLYAAVYLNKMFEWPLRWGPEVSHIVTLALMTGTFLAVYVLLRVFIHNDETFYASYRAHWNFSARLSIVGFLFFWVWVAFGLSYRAARGTVALYLLAASPYIIAITLIANPREIRLWVPLFLTFIILQYRASCTRST